MSSVVSSWCYLISGRDGTKPHVPDVAVDQELQCPTAKRTLDESVSALPATRSRRPEHRPREHLADPGDSDPLLQSFECLRVQRHATLLAAFSPYLQNFMAAC